MAYLNKIEGENYVKQYRVSLNKGWITYYQDYRIPASTNVTEYYITPHYNFGAFSISFIPIENLWTVSNSSLTFSADTPLLDIKIKAVEGYKEICDISYKGGDYSWRNKLYCGVPESTLNVTYDEVNQYEVYINGELALTTNQKDFNTISFNLSRIGYNSYSDPSVTTNYYTGNNPVTNGITGDFLLPEGNYEATWESTLYFTQVSQSLQVSFEPQHVSFTGNQAPTVTITKPQQECLYYKYTVDNKELENKSFSAMEGVSWSGLSSPWFYFTNSQYFTISFSKINNGNNIQCSCSSANRTSFDAETGAATYRLGNDKAIPTQIGNVTLDITEHPNPDPDAHPPYDTTKTNGVNNYNIKSTKDSHNLEEGDSRDETTFDENECTWEINKELKIQLRYPLTAYSVGTNLLKLQEQVICPQGNWQCYNCELIGDYIYANSEGAYIYQDLYRPKYLEEKDPNGLLNNTDYRQKHWSHFRYMESSFKKRTEELVDNETVVTEEPYTPGINLIYKAFGEYCDGHSWTATFDNITKCYDMLTCNGGGVATMDECLSTIQPEDYKLYDESAERGDEGYGVTYLNEPPQTNIGYLPNVVGRVQIPIPQNTKIVVGELKSVLSPDINVQGLQLYWEHTAQSEFSYEPSTLSGIISSETTYPYNQGDINNRAEFYSFNTQVYTLDHATASLFNDTHDLNHPIIIDLTNDWRNTFDLGKMKRVRIDLYFYETANPNVPLHAFQYFIGDTEDQNYYNFRIYENTASHKKGVELSYAKWTLDGYTYTFDEYHALKIKENLYYSKSIPRHELIFQTGMEFKKMARVGEHEPKPAEDESVDSFDCYESRYVSILINGARCGDMPDLLRIRNPHLMMSTTKPFKLNDYATNDTTSPSNKCTNIVPRDDLGEFHWNLYPYNADGDGYYDIAMIYNGSDTRVHYLYCDTTIRNGSWQQIVESAPEVDNINCSKMGRLLKSYWDGNGTWHGSSIHVKGSFGGMYNGVTNKLLSPVPHGYVKEKSPLLDTTSGTDGEFPISYIDVYGAYRDTQTDSYGSQTFINDRKHSTGEPKYVIDHGETVRNYSKWRINDNSRLLETVYDGMKYTLSYVFVRGGKILRNLAGKILRNSQHKILRGDDM